MHFLSQYRPYSQKYLMLITNIIYKKLAINWTKK